MPEGVHYDQRSDGGSRHPVYASTALDFGCGIEVRLQPIRVDAENLFLGVHEMRRPSRVGDRVAGRHEGESRNQNLVARLHACQQKTDVERRRAVRRDDRVRTAGVGGQIALETVDIAADRGNPARVQAIFHIGPLVARELRFMKRHKSLRIAQHASHDFQKPA